MESHPAVALNIIRSLALRLREAADRSVSYETLDLKGRLAAFLLATAETQGMRDPAGEVRLPKLTEQEIAERIGATRESVSRKLTGLRAIGAIKREGRLIVVKDHQRLHSSRSLW